jgi:crossover junction endodeoxyribonuclease RuvC
MLTLGIDPGTAIVGYGLVQEHNDGSLQALAYGIIRTASNLPMPQRLAIIHQDLEVIIQQYKPDNASVEELFFAKNVTTALTVAQGRGVILLTLQKAHLPIYEYKPNIVKQTVSGYGGADKSQMQEMVRVLLGLETIPKPDDAADALAIAITHIHNAPYQDLE